MGMQGSLDSQPMELPLLSYLVMIQIKFYPRCLINKCLWVVGITLPAGKDLGEASWNKRSSNLALKHTQASERQRWLGRLG